jgi:hypothetical protein
MSRTLKFQDKLSICVIFLFSSFYAHLDGFDCFRGLNLQHMRLLSSNVQLHLELKKDLKNLLEN